MTFPDPNHSSIQQQEPLNTQSHFLKQGEVIIGYIQGISCNGLPEVSFHIENAIHTYEALSTLPVTMEQLGRNVALSFVSGDLARPIVMGFLWQPDQQPQQKTMKTDIKNFNISDRNQEVLKTNTPESPISNVSIIQAHDRIELKCGQASITLSHTGKITIRGQAISSACAGTHRIAGGSIKLN